LVMILLHLKISKNDFLSILLAMLPQKHLLILMQEKKKDQVVAKDVDRVVVVKDVDKVKN
jgi:hypothetical protein